MKGLCFRCDFRAKFLEGGSRPRHECGDVNTASMSCYMYKPVKPVILGRADGYEGRPQFGSPMINARSRRVGDPEMEVGVRMVPSGSVLYWGFF